MEIHDYYAFIASKRKKRASRRDIRFFRSIHDGVINCWFQRRTFVWGHSKANKSLAAGDDTSVPFFSKMIRHPFLLQDLLQVTTSKDGHPFPRSVSRMLQNLSVSDLSNREKRRKKTRLRLLPTSFLETFAAKSVIRCPALLQGSINSRHEVGNSLSSIALCFLRYHLCISGRRRRRRNGQIQRIQGTQHCQLVAREKTKDYLLQMKFTSLIRGGTRKGTTARWRESISNAGRRGGLPSGGITMAPHPVGEAHSVWLTIYSQTKYANLKFFVFINQIHRWIKGEAVKLSRFSIFNRAKRNGRRTF